MLLIGALILILIAAYFFSERQKSRKDRLHRQEQDDRKALLEAVLKNNKDRIS